MSDDAAPTGPGDPRPNGEPYYIESECPECGATLELYDADVCHDEWWCPVCEDNLRMDWPADHREDIFSRVEEAGLNE